MSSNYPEGSMRGSGIFAEDIDVNMECVHCGHTWDTYVTTDDWGRVDEVIKCTACHEDFTFTLEPNDMTEFESEREWNE